MLRCGRCRGDQTVAQPMQAYSGPAARVGFRTRYSEYRCLPDNESELVCCIGRVRQRLTRSVRRFICVCSCTVGGNRTN